MITAKPFLLKVLLFHLVVDGKLLAKYYAFYSVTDHIGYAPL